jgi:hypothetical protein
VFVIGEFAMNLAYRSGAMPDDLAIDECTIRHARDTTTGVTWWLLWFYVRRDTDGEPEVFAVPVNPGGGFAESGLPGGRTWGLTRSLPGVWQVSPSINVLDVDDRQVHMGVQPGKSSLWHQTPTLLNVPAGEPWMV